MGAAAATVAARSVLTRQAAVARRRIGKPLGEIALDADRVWRPKLRGPRVELLLVGDSIAAGLGAERAKDVLGARIAKGVADFLGRSVQLRTVASVGAESRDLARQLDRLPELYRPEVAVVIVGGNDVTHRTPIGVAAAQLEEAVTRLRGLGAEVVVGTCPDLGALLAVPQPLRSLGAQASRQLARSAAVLGSSRCGARSGICSSRTPTTCSVSTASTRARSDIDARRTPSCPKSSRRSPRAPPAASAASIARRRASGCVSPPLRADRPLWPGRCRCGRMPP